MDVEFHAKVIRVEERFQTLYKKGFGEAKTENKAKDETEQISIGWWVSLAEWPISLRFGNLKPDIEPGDTLVLTAGVRKKEAPQ